MHWSFWVFTQNSKKVAFEANFLHDFPKKCSLCNTLSIDRVSMSYFCLSQDIKQKVLLSSYLENR